MDILSAETERRSEIYKDVSTKFSCLKNLRLNEEEYSRCCNNLVSSYQEDLSIDIAEVQQFQNYTHSKYQGKKTDFIHAELYDIIVQDQIRSVFPNLDIAFRIFLTFVLTNSAERSFSQLQRIKNPYSITMAQERLDSLSLLCIEAYMLRSVDFDVVIKDFALANLRKRTFRIMCCIAIANVCEIRTRLVSV